MVNCVFILGFNPFYLFHPFYLENSHSFSMFLIGLNEVQSVEILQGKSMDVWRRVRDQIDTIQSLCESCRGSRRQCPAARSAAILIIWAQARF